MQQKKIKNQGSHNLFLQMKLGWEQSEFPILCETCLGDNPYIRMLKTPYGKECKICQRPFTKFRWKAGTKGRYKETIVCQACAKIKNVCQTCLFDLDYGLPVEVRDRFLEDKKIVLPTSEKSRDYWIEQANSNIDQLNLPYDQLKSNEILDKLKKQSLNLKRNEPHYCTFFAKGMCNRGDECPYLHQIKEKEEPAEKNIKARFHGNDDPLAKKILAHIIKESEVPSPPENQEIKSLIIGKVNSAITKGDLLEILEQSGKIQQFTYKIPTSFITYDTRESAETAMTTLFGKFKLKDQSLYINWNTKVSNIQNENQPPEEEDEGLLIPGKGYQKISTGAPPPAPLLPPPEFQKNEKNSNFFVEKLLMKTAAYPSMNSHALGGPKKQ